MTEVPVGMLVSGGGRTVENMVKACRAGEVPARVVGMVSSSAGAFALDRARQLDIPSQVVRPGDHADSAALGEASFAFLRELGARWVLLGGYLSHILPPPDFAHRTLNIHPALLPAFGGKGMYGDRVHQAVLQAGVEVTGCTVHFVDELYDHGPILHQRAVPVKPGDTVESLAARVFAAEQQAYPQALKLILTGAARLERNRVVRS